MQMFFGKTVLIKENFSPELSSETTHIRNMENWGGERSIKKITKAAQVA